MPHIESQVHGPLASKGYHAFGVHVGDDVRFAIKTKLETGISFAMLIDYDNHIKRLYSRVGENVILFPLAYLSNCDGKINTIYTIDEPTIPSLIADIEASLCPQ